MALKKLQTIQISFLCQTENVNEWSRLPSSHRCLGNNAKWRACLKVAAVTQQPWIFATLGSDPDLADNQVFVERQKFMVWFLNIDVKKEMSLCAEQNKLKSFSLLREQYYLTLDLTHPQPYYSNPLKAF